MNEIEIINNLVSKELWFDFEIKSYDGFTLIIIGGIDLYYRWLVEITFSDVSFILLKSDWKANSALKAIEIIDNENAKNIKDLYYIGDNALLFSLNHEDVDGDNANRYFIAAKRISYKLNN